MTFKFWPHQDRIHVDCRNLYKRCNRIVVPAPCGAGKTAMMMRVIEDALAKGRRVVVYSCRIQNTKQLIEQIENRGIWYGVIAAAFRGRGDYKAPVQICQIQTVFARKKVFKQADIVIVDEAHQQMSDSALWVLNEHEKHGAVLTIGYTATPVGWKRWYKDIVDPPTFQELLDCKAHLPCKVFAPEIPEAVLGGRLKIQSNGEISSTDDKAINEAKMIEARVYEDLLTFNPQVLPTIGFGPDVDTCREYVSMGLRRGIRCASIDAERVVLCEKQSSGSYEVKHYESNLATRERAIKGTESGEFSVIWNRFVLREAVDMPFLKHCIVTTTMAGLATYLQSVGRVLRYFKDYHECTVQDHSGSVYLHGYPNFDGRDWRSAELADPDSVKKKQQNNESESQAEEQESELRLCVACKALSPREKGVISCPTCGTPFGKPVFFARSSTGELKYKTPAQCSPKRKPRLNSFDKYLKDKLWAAKKTGMTVQWAYAQAKRAAQQGGVKEYTPVDVYLPAKGSSEWKHSARHVYRGRLWEK